MSIDGRRIADNDIYLPEAGQGGPKQKFIFEGDNIASRAPVGPFKILDVGCAAGELIQYLNTRFPDSINTGMDVSTEMISHAQKTIPESSFYVGSALNENDFKKNQYDFVVSIGVLCIFDDIETPLRNMLSCLREGGYALINTIINDDSIDVISRYRRVGDEENGEWEMGWNIFSVKTIEKTLLRIDPTLELSWHTFELPFSLEKRPDPMRTWTIKTENSDTQHVNGACQLVNTRTICIRKST